MPIRVDYTPTEAFLRMGAITGRAERRAERRGMEEQQAREDALLAGKLQREDLIRAEGQEFAVRKLEYGRMGDLEMEGIRQKNILERAAFTQDRLDRRARMSWEKKKQDSLEFVKNFRPEEILARPEDVEKARKVQKAVLNGTLSPEAGDPLLTKLLDNDTGEPTPWQQKQLQQANQNEALRETRRREELSQGYEYTLAAHKAELDMNLRRQKSLKDQIALLVKDNPSNEGIEPLRKALGKLQEEEDSLVRNLPRPPSMEKDVISELESMIRDDAPVEDIRAFLRRINPADLTDDEKDKLADILADEGVL